MPLHQPQTSIMLGQLYASPWNEDMHMPWPSNWAIGLTCLTTVS
jgi:hypothetical protein